MLQSSSPSPWLLTHISHLAITPEDYSRRQMKVVDAKSMVWRPGFFGSCPAQLWLDSTLLRQLQTAVLLGHDRNTLWRSDNTLNILIQFESLKILMLCDNNNFFMWKRNFMDFTRRCSSSECKEKVHVSVIGEFMYQLHLDIHRNLWLSG